MPLDAFIALVILMTLLVPVHREQISEMNTERCGR